VAHLFRIAANTAFDWRRRQGLVGGLAELGEGEALPCYAPSPERATQARQAAAVLREAGPRLGVSERSVENHLASPPPIEDTPRAVSVPTTEPMKDQDINNIGEALERLPGVTVAGNIYARGQMIEKFQVDGGAPSDLNLFAGWAYSSDMRLDRNLASGSTWRSTIGSSWSAAPTLPLSATIPWAAA
jgi:outer membrane receptor protein involved in Fe transport